MDLVSIGTAETIEELRRRLELEKRFLTQEGLKVDTNETSKGEFTFIGLTLSEPNLSGKARRLFRHYLANALSDVIVNDWEKRYIDRLLKVNYSYFTPDEQAVIKELADQQLDRGYGIETKRALARIDRKGRIFERLKSFLENVDELVMEGFIAFRCKDYLVEVEDALDHAIDDFMLEKEYKEFIRLLKYFVDVQEPKIDEVHVIYGGPNLFRLVDSHDNVISNEYLEEIVVEMVDSDINYEDLLISALITIAPRRITLHCPGDLKRSEGIQTIVNVFTGRVTFCRGCKLCQPGQSATVTEKKP
ncbi:MAG: putative sporulation protein YtxC [Bacillota bacterium]